MKCILHIGTEKTGTTSLQNFLHRNRRVLEKHGYLYTKSAGLKNNRLLPVAAYNPSIRDSHTRMLEIQTDDQLIQHQTDIIQSLHKEISSTNAKTVIFCSEHIQSRLRTDEEIIRLKETLTEIGFNQFKVVVYLRAPADIAQSLYSTAILAGSTLSAPRPPDDGYWRNLCHHRNTLTRYRRQFGEDAMIPRIYDTDELIHHSVIEDFVHAIGLPLPIDKLAIPPRRNETMSATALAVLRRINSKVPIMNDKGEPNTLRKTIVSHIRQHLNHGPKYSMPLELRRQYEEAFQESNDWVRCEYFPDRAKLFADTSGPASGGRIDDEEQLDQLTESIYQTCLQRTSSPRNRLIRFWRRLRSSR